MTLFTKSVNRIAVAAAIVISVFSATRATASSQLSDLPDFSSLTPYTVFGNCIVLNLATVNGNVGISANGSFTMSAPSFINGRLDVAPGVTTKIDDPSHITLGINTGVDLSAAQALVFSASNVLKNLPADYTLGNVTTAQTFASVEPVTVIDVNNVTLGGSNNITLTGGPNDFFVLNISGNLALTGSSIIGAGNIDPSHILINLTTTSDLGTAAHIGNVLNGSVLIPFATATFHSMNGATFAGNGCITFMSGATIEGVPFVPEASTTSLLAFGGLLALGILWRRSARKAKA